MVPVILKEDCYSEFTRLSKTVQQFIKFSNNVLTQIVASVPRRLLEFNIAVKFLGYLIC